ncbi:hypothetical protein A5N15_01495 [Rothia kristinae]|uniref:Uncharacterized protein n=1 Tax=Rothia kristinae TaxID=37923 RepID=A0A657IXL8_9MICC|nr:hypothetical protein A5N15_01495 [Rothia kristinae]
MVGLLLGFLGTMLHASVAYFDGWYLPWGAILAVLGVFTGTVWTAGYTRRRGMTLVPGLAAFAVVGFFTLARSDSRLVIRPWRPRSGWPGSSGPWARWLATAVGVVVADRHRACAASALRARAPPTALTTLTPAVTGRHRPQ